MYPFDKIKEVENFDLTFNNLKCNTKGFRIMDACLYPIHSVINSYIGQRVYYPVPKKLSNYMFSNNFETFDTIEIENDVADYVLDVRLYLSYDKLEKLFSGLGIEDKKGRKLKDIPVEELLSLIQIKLNQEDKSGKKNKT